MWASINEGKLMFVSGAELLFLEDCSVLCVWDAYVLGVCKYLFSVALILPVKCVLAPHPTSDTHTRSQCLWGLPCLVISTELSSRHWLTLHSNRISCSHVAAHASRSLNCLSARGDRSVVFFWLMFLFAFSLFSLCNFLNIQLVPN